MANEWKPGDVVARLDGDRVELVQVSKCNGRRVVSYLIPGRKKPIAATGGEFVTVAQYPAAALRLYDKDERVYADVETARRAIMDEAETIEIAEQI